MSHGLEFSEVISDCEREREIEEEAARGKQDSLEWKLRKEWEEAQRVRFAAGKAINSAREAFKRADVAEQMAWVRYKTEQERQAQNASALAEATADSQKRIVGLSEVTK